MPREKLQITSINAGFAPTQDFGPEGSYQFGLAIDPDYSLTSALYRKSAAMIPVRYEKFSTTTLGGSPVWIITNPKNTNIYTYSKNPVGGSSELFTTVYFGYASLKAYYRFSAGALTTDATAGAHTLTAIGVPTENASGKFDGAVTYTAASSQAHSAVDHADFKPTGPFSISVWIKTATTGAVIFQSYAQNTNSAGIVLDIFNNKARIISAKNTGLVAGTDLQTASSTTTVTDNAWHYIVAHWDGTNLRVYCDGVLEGLTTWTNAPAYQATNYVRIGCNNQSGSNSSFFNGSMDDFSFFTGALGDSDVAILYSNAGNFVSYSNVLGTETLLSAVANGTGNGGAYYNNYIFLATNSTVARYGPLDGTAAYTESFWVTTLSKTALNNKTYPTIADNIIPNHPMHVHGDNALYFGDTLNGQGIIHKIKTKKVTVEGDTDDGSAYNALDLPFGFFPTDIESYGTDLVIVAIQTTDSDANQGRAALFLWDTVSDTFYAGPIYITDPLGTALLNVNGQIYVWSGSARQGCRLSKYLGGVQLSEVLILEDVCPPFAGAVAADGSRIYWGSFTVYPVASSCVYSFGSKDSRLSQGIHIPVRTSSVGATPNTTSLALYSQTGFARTKLVVGWKDASSYGIDKVSTSATYAAKWRSQPFNLGKKSRVALIRIPLGATLIANMAITPTLYFDDESSSLALSAINSTNFSGRHAQYKDIALKTANFENSFFLELAWTGTVECPVKFPIEIEVETFDNEK